MLNYIIIFIELILGLHIVVKRKFWSPHSIIFFLSFFYLNAVFLDHFLFDISHVVSLSKFIYIDFKSNTFFLINCLSFVFLLTFYIISIYNKKELNIRQFKIDFHIRDHLKILFYLLMLIVSFYNLSVFFETFEYTRTERNLLQNPLNLIARNTINYFFILFFLLKKNNNIITYFFFITNILLLVFSYEREPIVILFLIIVYKFRFFRTIYGFTFITFISFILAIVWKAFYTSFLYQTGLGIDTFVESISNFRFSLAGIDPLMSFIIFYDFINSESNIYYDYYLSYLSGPVNQLYRTFFDSDYLTLSEFTTTKYTFGAFGTAFSFMTESILNFWYFGPIFLGVLFSKVLDYSIKSINKFGLGIIPCFIYILIKLFRTEFATVLKLQVLPLMLSILILILFTYRNESEYLHTDL